MRFLICFIFCLSCTSCVPKEPNNQTNQLSIIDTIQSAKLNKMDAISQSKEKSTFILQLEDQGLIDIHSIDTTIQVELKYATTDNFTNGILYDELTEAYLHPIAAKKLVKAQELLKEYDSSLSLLVYDAARPLSIQKKMYAVVQNTPYHAYVANPSRTGLHNYGIAVDLTICQSDGTPLDMGTPFDFFGKAAGIDKEDELKAQGILTNQQIENRRLLRKIMVEAGFLTIRGEWWHFNAISLTEAKKSTKLIE